MSTIHYRYFVNNLLLLFKNVQGAYSGLINIFVNFYDKEARCAFFTYARFLIKITSTSQTARSGYQHFLGRISNYPLLCNKTFDQKLPDALALADFSMFGLTVLFLYQSRDLQLMYVM